VKAVCGLFWSGLYWVLLSVWVLGALGALCRVLLGDYLLLPMALVQGWGAGLALLNRGVKDSDVTAGRWVVPLCYLALLFLVPHGGSRNAVVWLFALGGSAMVAAGLWALGRRFSCAGCNWGGLCETGVYKVARHPQAVGIALQLVGAGLATGDGLRTGLCLVVVGIWTASEERFLMERPEYAVYASRVGRFGKW
jgi:protein-S-isoprenylcysteine O-methyltransferase Ste14